MPRTKNELIKWRDHLVLKRGKEHIEIPKSDHVFCRINGRPIKDFNKYFRQACSSAEIKDFKFHDLRQTFRTNLLLSGAGIDDLDEMMDHSDIMTTDLDSETIRPLCDWFFSSL
jgi:integrase